jgi:uncharacterized SAM-binding protein YcdF (DUF218 family)
MMGWYTTSFSVMILLILLALLWVVWLLLPRRSRRILKLPMLGIALGGVLISPIGVKLGLWGLTAFVPPDSGEPVQAIVVLGRGEDLRVSRVAEVQALWQDDRAPRIFASGMSDAKAIIQALEAAGIPGERLTGEECSQSTEENALFTNAILRPQGIEKILLVTDPPHLLRSFLLFRSFRFDVIPHSSSIDLLATSQERFKTEMREYFGLIQYALTGEFIPRSLDRLNRPPAEVTHKIRNWRCLRKG